MKFVDYYKILKVEADASDEAIKKSFRTLAKLYHPDTCVNKSEEEKAKNAEMLRLVYEAYEVLKDDVKRLEYDKVYYEQMRIKRNKERKNKETKEENTSTLKKIQNAYKEVRKEEKKKSFTKRHKAFGKILDEEGIKGKEIHIQLERGAIHVCAEAFYHVSKLTSFRKDSPIKFVLRNRNLILATVACAIVVGGVNSKKSEEPMIMVEYPMASEENVHDGKVYLTRMYKVQNGDSLEALSNECNTPVHTIKTINNKYSDDLDIGERLILQYRINLSDLKYYTYPVTFDKNISLEEFAEKYNTNIDDLITLNEEAIIKDSGVYAVLSDYLYVPKFISKAELEEKKAYNK